MPKMFLFPDAAESFVTKGFEKDAPVEIAYQLARIADALEKANEPEILQAPDPKTKGLPPVEQGDRGW